MATRDWNSQPTETFLVVFQWTFQWHWAVDLFCFCRTHGYERLGRDVGLYKCFYCSYYYLSSFPCRTWVWWCTTSQTSWQITWPSIWVTGKMPKLLTAAQEQVALVLEWVERQQLPLLSKRRPNVSVCSRTKCFNRHPTQSALTKPSWCLIECGMFRRKQKQKQKTSMFCVRQIFEKWCGIIRIFFRYFFLGGVTDIHVLVEQH